MTAINENKGKKCHNFKRLVGDRKGVAALEFALLAPLFFGMTFAIIEVLTYMLASMWLEDGTKHIEEMMQSDRNAKRGFDVNQYRAALCEKFPLFYPQSECTETNVKIAIWYSGRQANGSTTYSVQPKFPIQTQGVLGGANSSWGDVWVVGVEMAWPFNLPTTALLKMISGNNDAREVKPMLATVRTAVIPRELVANPSISK